jgi:hypothetical protein
LSYLKMEQILEGLLAIQEKMDAWLDVLISQMDA